jgi:subtilisin family serine protease
MVIRIALRKKTLKKIRVAILDTGVDFTHPSLAGKIKGGFDFITLTPGLPQDDNGHGTHIAGTLSARLEDDPFGLVPPIELYSVKILDKYAMGNLDNIILGLTWALDNKIDVVNMSIGYREDSPAVRLAIKKAYEAGLIMVAAAGNHSNWDDPSPVAAGERRRCR